MNKTIDNAYLNKCTDNAIKRGYNIYDEWLDKKLSSRKIVALAEGAVKIFKKRKTVVAFIDALAHLFALDARIKEKYSNIFRCIFSYFSWRRETRALASLKSELNFPINEADIRNAIAVLIENLVEKLDGEFDEDGDDETHGGKRNGKAEAEEVAKEKEKEDTAEKSSEAEVLADEEKSEKDSEEKEEITIEESLSKEDPEKEEIDEKEETFEPQIKEAEATATDEKEELAPRQHEDSKKEDNVPDNGSEPSINTKEEVKAYNDAVDSPPPSYEERVTKRTDDKISFIDEMIIDDMVKGDKTIIGYRRIDEASRNRETGIPQNTEISRNEKNNSTDKDAYLYDKMIATDKGEAQQTLNAEPTKQAEKVSETKTEQPKETIQNNDNVQSNDQEFKPLSEMLQADLNESLENQVIKELVNTMSDESREAFAQMQMDVAREKLSIAYAELGIDEPAEIIGMHEPEQIKQPSNGLNRK